MEITTIGLDLAKNFFQVHGIDEAGAAVLRRTLWKEAPWRLTFLPRRSAVLMPPLASSICCADTDKHDLAVEAAGLHALSLGMSVVFVDDQALLARALILYDALYAWATKAWGKRHDWRPAL